MTTAIIVAAGNSRRMGFNKLLASLRGQPVLAHTLAAFQACEAITTILLVTHPEVAAEVTRWQQTGGFSKLHAILPGGTERHFSVWSGLQSLPPGCTHVAVHDGARPLIQPAQITACIATAVAHQAAVCARPMTETVKRADDHGHITEAIDRTGLWVMETPQVFEKNLLIRAYETVLADGLLVTDEVSAVQHLGQPVHVVEHSHPNPKITFPADLTLAERLLP